MSLIVPSGRGLTSYERRKQLVEQWDENLVECLTIAAYIFGAIAGGGRGAGLDDLLQKWQKRLNGAYATLLTKATAIHPQALAITRNTGLETLLTAMTHYLDQGGNIDELENLAALFDPVLAQPIARRQTLDLGGSDSDPRLDALYRLAKPLYHKHQFHQSRKWKLIRQDIEAQIQNPQSDDEITVADMWLHKSKYQRREQLRKLPW